MKYRRASHKNKKIVQPPKRNGLRINRERGKGDRALYMVVAALVLFGTLMVFSGSVPIAAAQNKPPYDYFVKQLMFVVIGAGLFIFTYNFDYRLYPKFIVPALILTAILLIAVLFAPEINASHRWLSIGGFTFQVSDVAKLTLTIYLASWLSRPFEKKKGHTELESYLKYNLLPFLLIIGFFAGLILIQPNLSTTALIGIIAISIYFVSGDDILHNIGTFGMVGTMGVLGILAGLLADYRFNRIVTFTKFLFTGELAEPFGRDYQLRQILIAVGTGHFFGQGFAQSKQKFSYLTETAFSDTIFAIFAEEFGFFGSIILIGIFVWLMYRGFKIAQSTPDKLGALMAIGFTIWISFQAFIHIGVNVGLIPLTGMPLPFISYGGSSLVATMTAIGILVNISRYSTDPEINEK